jgi:hypothetical protein
MKYLIVAASLLLAGSAVAGPILYPPEATPEAIAADQAVKASIVGRPDVERCILIDTRDPHGRCILLRTTNDGGDTGGR